MDPAVKTNLNGVNTLTKRVNELKEEFAALLDKLDSLPISSIQEQAENVAKRANINARRIATIRSLDLETKFNIAKAEIKSIDHKLSRLTASVDDNTSTLATMYQEIVELKVAIAENTAAIATNATDIKVNGFKIKDVLGSVEIIAAAGMEFSEDLKKVNTKLTNTDKVVDGCIIGIDINSSRCLEIAKASSTLAHVVADNVEELGKHSTLITKSVDAIELSAVQIKTNAINIRKK